MLVMCHIGPEIHPGLCICFGCEGLCGFSLNSFYPINSSIQIVLVTLDRAYSMIKKNSLHRHLGWAVFGEVGLGMP